MHGETLKSVNSAISLSSDFGSEQSLESMDSSDLAMKKVRKGPTVVTDNQCSVAAVRRLLTDLRYISMKHNSPLNVSRKPYLSPHVIFDLPCFLSTFVTNSS